MNNFNKLTMHSPYVQNDKPLLYIKREDLPKIFWESMPYLEHFLIWQTSFIEGPYLCDVNRYLHQYWYEFPKNKYWTTALWKKIALEDMEEQHISNILCDASEGKLRIDWVYRKYFEDRTHNDIYSFTDN